MDSNPGVAIVTGASGQDGYYLSQRLLLEGWSVFAVTSRPEFVESLTDRTERRGLLQIVSIDIEEPTPLFDLIAKARPEEIYNLAGQSSVSKSFSDPSNTWRTNAELVEQLLECIRLKSPETRFYQASTTDMFGDGGGSTAVFSEHSLLNPLSPYAAAKTAAHLLCGTYRKVYALRIACGILSNHESNRRRAPFLTRKIVDHVVRLRNASSNKAEPIMPLTAGNLQTRRDWGYAPDYVEGMSLILRQIKARCAVLGGRAIADEAIFYRDYVLGTGLTHTVWQIIDRAFHLAGFDLDWNLAGQDPTRWGACFRTNESPAVVVDAELLRPADPLLIQVDPSLAKAELGWSPHQGLDIFLKDMLFNHSDWPAKRAAE